MATAIVYHLAQRSQLPGRQLLLTEEVDRVSVKLLIGPIDSTGGDGHRSRRAYAVVRVFFLKPLAYEFGWKGHL